jgi:RHS repeat-associated protein
LTTHIAHYEILCSGKPESRLGDAVTDFLSGDAFSNRITGMTENAAALRSYAYDNGGNIITDTRPGEVFAFAYNNRNRPTSVTRNSVPYASYSYNAFEQLVSRSTSAPGGPSGTIHYIHDLDGHVIAEADASTGAIARDYIWMASNDNTPTDLPLAVAEGASLYQVHTDHLGRPTRMTDAAKASVWQAAYNPHGEAASLSGSAALNLRFPGQVFQIETGLAYNWHRHYDATTGRYTQPDPLRFVDGPSIYAYAGNSPYMYVDRRGLFDKGFAAGGSSWGHSDFPGSLDWKHGPFDYNMEDKDAATQPFNWPDGTARHFRSQGSVEADLSRTLLNCDMLQFERFMHQGQDYFVHAKKGYGPTFGHLFGGTSPDHDDAAWAEAALWSNKWLEMWRTRCDCQK